MPRYDYQCEHCRLVFEVRQSFSSEPVATCPDCMNGARRVIHSVPVVFKGSGFYVNDYGSGSRSASSSSEPKETAPKKDSKAETKSDTKAEAGSSSGAKKESASSD